MIILSRLKFIANRKSLIVSSGLVLLIFEGLSRTSTRADLWKTSDITGRSIFSGLHRFSRFTATCLADCLRLMVKVSTLKADARKFPSTLTRSREPFNESREIRLKEEYLENSFSAKFLSRTAF